jgi:hypothetical protein
VKGDHDLACRLAGLPVLRRAADEDGGLKRRGEGFKKACVGMGGTQTGAAVPVNGPASGVKTPGVDLGGTRTRAANQGKVSVPVGGAVFGVKMPGCEAILAQHRATLQADLSVPVGGPASGVKIPGIDLGETQTGVASNPKLSVPVGGPPSGVKDSRIDLRKIQTRVALQPEVQVSVSGPPSGVKTLGIDLNKTQTGAVLPPKPSVPVDGPPSSGKTPGIDAITAQKWASQAKLWVPVKRPAENQMTSGVEKKTATNGAMAGKQARVEDAPDDDISAPTNSDASKKRVAFVDPAVLREVEDGRTKRTKVDATNAKAGFDVDGTRVVGNNKSEKDMNHLSTCLSCMDRHPQRGMLHLPCKDKYSSETHAYCRDCLRRLFECSVTDPSQFPPRCCSKIIPAFSCLPFLPSDLYARFVAKREELETPDRTYCSNTECSKWVRPIHIEGNVAICPYCAQTTCTTCKGKIHGGLCPRTKASRS